ncbi:2-oxoglutarate ferredoxin oxidoreductase subunit alpha [Deltaproteobacteria bacterium]|nr:2-oxoglutarate ferredoxin oxidoreductase subunit alpha [Deltaproteobacteria bacterium]
MKTVQSVDHVVIRFAGDSGDGMQIVGSQFTNTTALLGNDLATFPDFPAEIRAPAGTLAGVSGFQLHFASHDIFTPGDAPEAIIAMNPAALKANVADLKKGGLIIANKEKFIDREFEKAGITSNPLEDGSLSDYQVVSVDLARQTKLAVDGLGLSGKETERCKNFYALGMTYWLYSRPMETTERWINAKFKEPYREANLRALRAGFNYAETVELFTSRYEVAPMKQEPGLYRNIMGNQAAALGLVVGASKANVPLFLGSYPITPASDILHYLSGYKAHGVITFQAEDEIAAITSAIGASFGGHLGLTTTSGPGMALKTEAMGLAVMTELPLVIVNIQRGGPSTGLPTKTEQSDLLQAVYGRNGECPIPVIAASTPSDCFEMAVEAVRIAVTYMTPVILLTDGYLANGSEPWRVPNVDNIPAFPVSFHTETAGFKAYSRNPETLARPWVRPGTPGLEHRIGGIEKAEGTGNVSYEPLNHELMVKTRAAKVAGIKVPDVEVHGDPDGLLVVGWGSTFGAIRVAVDMARREGLRVAHAHVRHIHPLPANLLGLLGHYGRVIVPEMNLGQLVKLLREQSLVDCVSIPKVQGQAFKIAEVLTAIRHHQVTEAK